MKAENEYILSGLTCSHCASVIEDEVNKLSWVKEARVNLATQVLYLDTSSMGNRKEELQTLVDTIEDGLTVEGRSDNKTVSSHDQNIFTLLTKRIPEILGSFLFMALTLANGNDSLPLIYRIPLYAIAYVLIGRSVLLQGLRNMKRGRFLDENFLMIIATAGAFAIQEFPEAVAVMLFYQFGEFFQDMAVDRSRRSIRNLMDSKPGKVRTISDGEIIEVDAEDVLPGTVFQLRPGDRIPLDGQVAKGQGNVDTSALTGESYPRQVSEGSTVLSGFVNKDALLEVTSTKSLEESAYSRIIRMVEESSSRKARSEQFITRFAKYYTPAVVGLAALLAVLPPLLLADAQFSDWFYRALVFLVVSCPCALVVSIPLGFFAGIGRSSREGILVKGGNYLEALNRIDTIFMDKTGTLTKGVFTVSKIISNEGISEEQILALAASAESSSSHPIAQAILQTWREKGGALKKAESQKELAGKGLQAQIEGQTVSLGQSSWIESLGFETVKTEFGTAVHMAVDGEYWGAIVLSDEIRNDSAGTIQSLKTLGIKDIIMLTGDSAQAAESVAHRLKLDAFQAGLLPQGKVDALENAIKQGRNSAFVGDGINDAPVLARADVGIAMGGLGSDAAIEAADIVLMADEPSRIVTALNIARKTRNIVIQNIVFALGIKALILVLAALGYAGMGLAVFGDVGVALLAILNVLRIMSGRVSTSRT